MAQVIQYKMSLPSPEMVAEETRCLIGSLYNDLDIFMSWDPDYLTQFLEQQGDLKGYHETLQHTIERTQLILKELFEYERNLK